MFHGKFKIYVDGMLWLLFTGGGDHDFFLICFKGGYQKFLSIWLKVKGWEEGKRNELLEDEMTGCRERRKEMAYFHFSQYPLPFLLSFEREH